MTLPALLLLFSCAAHANDGFFWGAGSTLRPVNNKNLRVRREELTLAILEPAPCYKVLYRGKDDMPGADYRWDGGEFATIGPPGPCGWPAKGKLGNFSPHWTADAVYEVEAQAEAKDVVFGFPVNTWESEFNSPPDGDLNSVPAPGVAAFHTYEDGTELATEGIRWFDGVGSSSATKTLGYVWRASFAGGKQYKLRTTYQVGIDVSNSFYHGREYPEGEKPWWLDQYMKEEGGYTYGANRLIYYLTPLSQWAPPVPDEVLISATLSKSVPMLAAVPIYPKPYCVGERTLFYRFQKRLPEHELELSYPVELDRLKAPLRLQTKEQLDAWLATLGGPQVEFNCALLNRLKKESAEPVARLLEGRKCRQTCRQ